MALCCCLPFRVFAPRCAACQKPIAPEPVSAVIAIQRERVGRGEGEEQDLRREYIGVEGQRGREEGEEKNLRKE